MKHEKESNPRTNNILLLPFLLLKKSARGYAGLLGRLFWVPVAIFAIGLTSFIIVYPLWYVSIRYTRLYGTLTLLFLAALLLFFMIRKLYEQISRTGGFSAFFRAILPRLFMKAARMLLSLFGLYFIVLLFVRGYRGEAVLSAVFYLLIFGLILSSSHDPA